MTVEIKELVIRAVVEAGPAPEQREPPARQAELSPLDREALVAECVREVLRTLERRRSR